MAVHATRNRKRAVSARRAQNASAHRHAAGVDSGLRADAPCATLACMSSHATAAIRRAESADLDALVALEQATFTSDCISRTQWRRHLASPSGTVLVHGAPARIDAAGVVFYRRGSQRARLYSLAVGAGTRGSGIGGALLAAIEADARGRGCTVMHLEVRTDNTAAIALYERRGYVRGARVAGFYEDGGDAWRYAKRLAPAPHA